MTIRRMIFGSAVAVALGIAPGVLGAQSTTPPSKPTTPVIAGIARAPQDSRARDHSRDADRDHDRDGGYEHRRDQDRDGFGDGGIRVGHFFFGPEVPVIVGSDGHVYANFGYGYQPVLENCGNAQYPSLSAAPPTAPTVQPQVTQPVVVQPGAAPSPTTQSGSVARIGEAPSTMCWATDERGQLRVGRR